MGLVQRILTAILPSKTMASLETESRKWMVKCNTCSTERSLWEIGGVRGGAKGSKTTRTRCEKCGKNSWHSIYFAG